MKLNILWLIVFEKLMFVTELYDMLIFESIVESMKESINLIGGLFNHVDKHNLFKYVQILNMSYVR